MTDPIKIAFAEAGRPYHEDGRSHYHKALRDLVNTGLVEFKVAPLGRVYTRKDGVNKYNIRVSGGGMSYFQHCKNTYLSAYDVLKVAGCLLSDEKVKSQIKSVVDTDNTCTRCNGLGYIPQFNYFCNGICFGCCGIGYDIKFKATVKIDK